MRVEDLKHDARGRWPGIMAALGIEIGTGKHTKCPACGGKDRFRFDDKEGDGTFYCNQCGAGNGFGLIMNVLNIEFPDAMKEVARLCGSVEKGKVLKEKKVSPETLRRIFLSSKPMKKNDPVGLYLRSRGIKLIPEKLRYMPKCYDTESKKEHPAMLAVVSSKDGKAITMHRTYLKKNGEKAEMEKCKKLLPGLEKLTGGAIRLWEMETDKLGIAEGIETALSCYEYFGVPTWSTINSTLMEKFEVPKNIKQLVIFADNDSNYTGQKAAYTLANRLMINRNIKVSVKVPEIVGEDFADEYRRNYSAL